MDLGYIKKLIKILSDSEVHELEIEEDGKKIRIVKPTSHGFVQTFPVSPSAMPASFPHPHVAATAAEPPQTGTEAPAGSLPAAATDAHEVKSPIVGTFYRSPAPDAAPFVQEGSVVSVGTVLCIVEAMKLMNEIESDAAGKISKILAENGQPVEYGQTLFIVEKS